MPYIQFLGAAGTVTGSKHLINTSYDSSGKQGFQVLIDCGLFQGQKEWRERNWQDTADSGARNRRRHPHARAPRPLRLDSAAGERRLPRPDLRHASRPSICARSCCPIPDTCRKKTRSSTTRRRTSKHNPALPLYTLEEAQDCLKYFKPVEFETSGAALARSFPSALCARRTFSARAWRKSRCKTDGHTRTPALHRRHRARAQQPDRARESRALRPAGGRNRRRAGDGVHLRQPRASGDDPRPELARLIRDTVARGGSVIVPAFAVERTQKFIFILKELMESGRDSAHSRLLRQPDGDQGSGDFPEARRGVHDASSRANREVRLARDWPSFTFALTSEQSKKINDSSYPSVIISSSGMVTGGRILHHLAQRLPDPRNLIVLFIGFQAPGTRGASIKAPRGRSQDFRADHSGSRSGCRTRTVQRPCRSAGVAGMAADVQGQTGASLI